MGLIPTNLINEPQKMLSLIAQRQEALGDNIANMHTVGYRRKDVDFSQYLNSTQKSSTLEAKAIDKFGPAPITSSASAGGERKTTEEELVLMQENYMIYNVAVKELSSTITQIKTALNISAS